MKERKAFNFFKSYYDIAKELPEDLRGEYLMGILDYQFTGVEPEFTGILKIAWIGQKHSLDKQLIGFKHGAKGGRPLGGKSNPPPRGKPNPPLGGKSNQEQEQVQEQVEVQEEEEEELCEKKFSQDVQDCLDQCLEFFPKDLRPQNSKQVEKWLDTIEKLYRIDKLNFVDIIHLVQVTRQDDFWSKNFLSIQKLRKKNKEGLIYWKVFLYKFKKTNQNGELKKDKNGRVNVDEWARDALERIKRVSNQQRQQNYNQSEPFG